MTPKVAISSGACPDRPILDALPSLAASGAEAIEVGTPPRHFDPWQPPQVEALADGLARVRLRAVSIHAPFGGPFDLADPNPRHRETALESLLVAARAVKRLGGQAVVAHPSDLERHQHDVEARLADCARGLSAAASACRQEGITLALESPLPHLVGGQPDEFERLLQAVDSGVQVCLDTGHLSLGRNWRRFLEVSAGRLAMVHVNDNHGHWDDHLAPGDGVVNWQEVVSSLAEVDFAGWLVVEMHCPGDDADRTFRRAVTQTKTLLGMYHHAGGSR